MEDSESTASMDGTEPSVPEEDRWHVSVTLDRIEEDIQLYRVVVKNGSDTLSECRHRFSEFRELKHALHVRWSRFPSRLVTDRMRRAEALNSWLRYVCRRRHELDMAQTRTLTKFLEVFDSSLLQQQHHPDARDDLERRLETEGERCRLLEHRVAALSDQVVAAMDAERKALDRALDAERRLLEASERLESQSQLLVSLERQLDERDQSPDRLETALFALADLESRCAQDYVPKRQLADLQAERDTLHAFAERAALDAADKQQQIVGLVAQRDDLAARIVPNSPRLSAPLHKRRVFCNFGGFCLGNTED